jgi:integrase
MARHATEPKYYKSRKGYYTQIGGKQVPLAIGPEGGTTLEAAWERFRHVHAANPAKISDDSHLCAVLEAHLAWVEMHRDPPTYATRRKYLDSFHVHFGLKKVGELKRHHVQKWLDEHPAWNVSTKALALKCLKAALNWAADLEMISRNPLAGFRAGGGVAARVTLINRAQHEALLARLGRRKNGRAVLGLLEVLWQTGARPGEVARATAAHVDWERRTIVLERHKTSRKTGKVRTIYLNPQAFEVVRRAAAEHPKGPLFPTRTGLVYRDKTLSNRFADARNALGLPRDITPYSYRHAYATDWLRSGKPVAILAELLGTSIAMIEKHYGHLARHADDLRVAADGFLR